MDHRDVVIVGAGPAGSSCAWKLRGAGLNVLVLDRQQFPRDKTCAGWITPDVLDALDLTPQAYGPGRVIEPIRAFRIGIIGGRAVDVAFDRTVSYGVRRAEFDHVLVGRCGAEFRPAVHVASVVRDGATWVLNGQIATRVLVGAGGTSCPVARVLNPQPGPHELVVTLEAEIALERPAESSIRPGIPEFYFSRDFSGYGWIFRKGDYATVGLGRRDPRLLRDHLDLFVRFLRDLGRAADFKSAIWRGHSYRLRGAGNRCTVADGALLVGDAAGYANPTSGEGIWPAIASGLVAAESIVQAAGDYRADRLQDYPRRVEQRLGPPGWRRGLRRLAPRSLEHALGRRLVTNPWFARHVVLERWFLHQ